MALAVHTMATVRTRAGVIAVSTAGQAVRSLLVITPMSDWMIAALPAELCDLFTVHVAQFPGGGSADAPAGASTVSAVGEAVHDLAETLGDRPVLFGHSMNGCLALVAAATAACSGVIAVTPPPALPPDPAASTAYWDRQAEPERRRRANEIIKAHGAAVNAQARAKLESQFTRLRRWYDLDFDPTKLDALATLDEHWVSSIFESGETIDWRDAFRRLDQPVLLALGEYDFVAPPDAWTADLLPPAATVHRFEQSGHTPYVEQKEEFVETVAAWTTANISTPAPEARVEALFGSPSGDGGEALPAPQDQE
jgi:pimeloyl-ACP methyl ester carboxylesterase